MLVEKQKPVFVGVNQLMAVGNYETVGVEVGGTNLGDLMLYAGLGAAIGHFAFQAKGPKKLALFAGGAILFRFLVS